MALFAIEGVWAVSGRQATRAASIYAKPSALGRSLCRKVEAGSRKRHSPKAVKTPKKMQNG
jgi:hypothetical protein